MTCSSDIQFRFTPLQCVGFKVYLSELLLLYESWQDGAFRTSPALVIVIVPLITALSGRIIMYHVVIVCKSHSRQPKKQAKSARFYWVIYCELRELRLREIELKTIKTGALKAKGINSLRPIRICSLMKNLLFSSLKKVFFLPRCFLWSGLWWTVGQRCVRGEEYQRLEEFSSNLKIELKLVQGSSSDPTIVRSP